MQSGTEGERLYFNSTKKYKLSTYTLCKLFTAISLQTSQDFQRATLRALLVSRQ